MRLITVPPLNAIHITVAHIIKPEALLVIQAPVPAPPGVPTRVVIYPMPIVV